MKCFVSLLLALALPLPALAACTVDLDLIGFKPQSTARIGRAITARGYRVVESHGDYTLKLEYDPKYCIYLCTGVVWSNLEFNQTGSEEGNVEAILLGGREGAALRAIAQMARCQQ